MSNTACDYNPRDLSVGIIGSGAAGLITAYTLLQDGFKDVQIISRDATPGGVWSQERVYPGLQINNVHGKYRFSPLMMRSPHNSATTGGRLTGDDMRNYMEMFATAFLRGKFLFNMEVLKIQRESASGQWLLEMKDTQTDSSVTLRFSRIVLCSGGTTIPKIPDELSPASAKKAGFKGLVIHPITFRADLEDILAKVKERANDQDTGSVVIIGGGKSAQDHAAYLANEGWKVTVVFEQTDTFVAAGKKPLPPFIRKSWRFFHCIWLGSKIAMRIWNTIAGNAFKTFEIPVDSPLWHARSPFWAIRANDEGIAHSNSFHSLVLAGKIDVVCPARVTGFTEDGEGVLLSNGSILPADILIVATGYTSSWETIFDEDTANELGIRKISLGEDVSKHEWNYLTLANPPTKHPDGSKYFLPIYRGIIPSKNIDRRNFAINGAVIIPNNGYAFEVFAHWISSYFLGDQMRLPSPDEALAHAEHNAQWLHRRYPEVNLWENPSISSGVAFWNWPQAIDELLEDMGLRTRRSGGNWLTWPFQVIDTSEIADLREERMAKREGITPY
ncbi:FAD-containing monooxygenase EthA [Hypsizygus marmoreus]|uniref:FAD-containing monooxygenase EthA n=1 Tax=Hypsizygus marmoreus TaxID=39966 RepID=A0A369KBJ4_HYPMA|nr:FAD-containing monooxygenase EthA [Hypsizygus marmoreus]